MQLDLGSFLLQWATGGLAFLWVTTRHRTVSLGYGWLLRGVYGALGMFAAWAELRSDHAGMGRSVFLAGTGGLIVAAGVALAVSVTRRGAGVRGQRADRERKAERVAAMVARPTTTANDGLSTPEFPPALDAIAPVFGVVGLLGAAAVSGGPYALTAVRLVVGGLFLGSVTDAMMLGHWYLTQPGLARESLEELVLATAIVWPLELLVLCWPPGMLSALSGSVDDGYGGLLGWMWAVSAASTLALVGATWLALRERYYSAVMAATGLLYLALLTAFGTDLVARAVLAP